MSKAKKSGVSRRTFVKTVGLGAAAALMYPRNSSAEDKKYVMVGEGDHKYEFQSDFCKLPDTHKFGNCHGVQQDGQGRMIIHSQGAAPDSVLIFDNEGKFIKSWGKQYVGGAHGLQLVKEDGKEFLYLALTGQHICVKTTLDGEKVWEIGFPKECDVYGGKPDKFVPTNIAIAKNGDFYVADGYGSNLVHQYDKTTKYIRTFGGTGNAEGQLRQPHGIWIDTRNGTEEVLVADRANVRLQWFSLDGKFLRLVKDELRHPCHFDTRGDELLIPDLKGRITLFNKENKLICHLGDNKDQKKWAGNGVPKEQWEDGQFIAPHGACYDKDGNIFVAEWVRPGRVTRLKKV
jgi:hypothetical protein